MDEDGSGTISPETEIRIVGDDGVPKIPEKRGSSRSAPRMTAGYLWDEALNARHFIDGWFRTDDVGTIPRPGTLVLFGRADDMLNIGGVKVSPYPIEERIESLAGVSDAVLLAAPDPAISTSCIYSSNVTIVPTSLWLADWSPRYSDSTNRRSRRITPRVCREPRPARRGETFCALNWINRRQVDGGFPSLTTFGAVMLRGSTMRSKSASPMNPRSSAARFNVRSCSIA